MMIDLLKILKNKKKLYQTGRFKQSEVACKHCGEDKVDFNALKKLNELREEWGKPLVVNSGYRCPTHNNNIGGAPKSKHIYGIAFDIKMPSEHQHEFVKLAKKHDFNGIGWYNSWIHIDTRSEPAEWDARN